MDQSIMDQSIIYFCALEWQP